jgi:RNA polymerase sigma factor (sigma-70 family)
MNILTCCHEKEGNRFGWAQRGCEQCMEYLLEGNVGLIHAVVRYAEIGGVPYMEAVEEGRVGLWHAIRRYDPGRGIAFSTFAWRFIWGRVWRYTLAFRQQGEGLEEEPYEWGCAELAEEAWQQEQIAEALREELTLLPERLRRVVEQAYGMGEGAPQSMAEIGRAMGITRERVRQLRNEGLAMLRLPALSPHLRGLCECDSRQAYRRSGEINAAWLGRRRGKK